MKMSPFLVAAVAVLMLCSDSVAAEFGGVREFSAYHSLSSFNWKEYSEGRELLEEQGAIFALGAAVTTDLLKTEAGYLTLRGNAELFGGKVSYDGQTQPPNSLPVKTDVIYFGSREEMSLGWSLPVSSVLVEPFAGIGHRWWLRDLQDSAATSGSGATVPVHGYTEDWQTVYSKLGVDIDYVLNERWQLFWEFGGKYPFYNTNTLQIVDLGDVTIRPEGRWSYFGEIGARYKKFRMGFFYDSYRTGESSAVRISSTTAIMQPQSKEDVFGARFSWCFK